MFNNISNWGQQVNWSNDQIKQRLYCISSNLGRRSSVVDRGLCLLVDDVLCLLSDWPGASTCSIPPTCRPGNICLRNNLHILYSGNSNEGTPPVQGTIIADYYIQISLWWDFNEIKPRPLFLSPPSCPACRDINIKTKRGNILQFPGCGR